MSKKTVKKSAPKKEKSFEETLWETANKLRGSVESSDWSGATKTIRQGYPKGERGGANQYNHVALFPIAHSVPIVPTISPYRSTQLAA